MVTGRRERGGLENVTPHENLSGLVGCNGGDEKMGTVIYARRHPLSTGTEPIPCVQTVNKLNLPN